MRREITKAKTTDCCFRYLLQQSLEHGTRYDVGIGWAVCWKIMSGKRHEQRILRTSDSNHRLSDLWPDIYAAAGFEIDGGGVLVLVASDVAIAGVSRSQRTLYSDGLDLLAVAQACRR